jgi:hypothetical protein
VCLTVTTSEVSGELLGSLSQAAMQFSGQTPLYFKILGEDGRPLEVLQAAPDFRVTPTPEFEKIVETLLPSGRIEYAS